MFYVTTMQVLNNLFLLHDTNRNAPLAGCGPCVLLFETHLAGIIKCSSLININQQQKATKGSQNKLKKYILKK